MKLFSTSCETLYLGWEHPLLPRSLVSLRDKFADAGRWDLHSVVCVLPGIRAVQRLESLLKWEAEEQDLELTLPQIITVGQLPELLYQPSAPIALEFEQTLAWARVLRSVDPQQLMPLVPTLPSAEPIGPWLELASTLRRLHEDLSSNRLSFRNVAEAAETDSDKRRWRLMSKLFDQYLTSIAQAGLADPHWSRQQAVLSDRCRTDKTIVLIGTSDLSDALIAMLRSLESDLISLVAAPPRESFRFDEFGCVDTTSWLDHELPLQDQQVIAAGDIGDQSCAVAQQIGNFAQRFSADQVTVGVTDDSHLGPVEIELRGCGVKTFRHQGWTLSETSVGRLLELTATFLHRRTWQTLAALVRHADVHAYLCQRLPENESPCQQDSVDWLTQLDGLLANHYPVRVGDPLPLAAVRDFPLAPRVLELIEACLSVFSGPDQSIAAWSQVTGTWLEEIYAADATPHSHRTAMALSAADRLIKRFVELNDHVDLAIGGASAIETLHDRLSDVRIADKPQADDVEILGWLDLALDDAPAMVVMGLNHPFVPGATTSDPFLPGSLRTRLRMADNERRYARDVYAMHLMLSTRSAIRFIVGKTGADRSPTPPSRLLAAAPATDAARRIRQLFGQPREEMPVHHRWDVGEETVLAVPRLPDFDAAQVRPITSMSVTAFRDYLMCPYRFFLRHVLKLRPLDDASSELAANQFGDLVHASLERFGLSGDRDLTDVSSIEQSLLDHLDRFAAEVYGDHVSTAVRIQISQARSRLKVVAQRQAERIAEGWKIVASEASAGKAEGAGIDVDGEWMGLRGRFDRIDRHEDGRYAILDYKTHGHAPEKKHLQSTSEGEKWIDLQLPLYRLMVPFLGIEAPPEKVQLGYFNIAEKEEDTRINIAQFSEPQMAQAEALIRDCIRRIRAGDFQATRDRVQFDDYGMILQTGVASRLWDQADRVLEEVEG